MASIVWILFAAFLCWNGGAQAVEVMPPIYRRLEITLDLMKTLHDDVPSAQNLLITPLSIIVALTVTFEGAPPGKVREDLGNFIALSSKDDESQKQLAERLEILKQFLSNSSLPYTEVNVGAGLYIDKDVSIRKEFIDEMLTKYRSQVTNIDFSASGKESVAVINKYISDTTKGRIPSIISSGLDSKSHAIIVSAFYFSGVWKDTFLSSQTKPAKFHTGLEQIEVQMMSDLKRVLYYDDPALMFEAIQIPFKKNDEYLFTIVLPYKDQSLKNLTHHMKGSDLEKALYSATKSSVEYQLPRMKFSSHISMKNTLTKLGLGSLFDSKSQFSKISPTSSLILTDFLHAAEIEVDEMGIKAGAGTKTPAPTFAIDFLFNQKKFFVDRPFMLLVYNRPSAIVFHGGFVYNPNGGAV